MAIDNVILGEVIDPDWGNAVADFLNQFKSDTIVTEQSTTSTSYTDLATAGPAVTVTTGTGALVLMSCRYYGFGGTNNSYISVAVSGASTLAADDSRGLRLTAIGTAASGTSGYSQLFLVSGLTAGVNTFTAKYKVAASHTGYFSYRTMLVIPMA